MRRLLVLLLVALPVHARDADDPARAGGGLTIFPGTEGDAVSPLGPILSAGTAGQVEAGRRLFDRTWIAAPSDFPGSDGLGPLFNARSCRECHGFGGAEGLAEPVFRTIPRGGDPDLGAQIQPHAFGAAMAEPTPVIQWTEVPVTLSDGLTVTLRAPVATLPDGRPLSMRLSPPLFGMGLIEAIPPADILSHADPADADGDGISGRTQVVLSPENGDPQLGRFGFRAEQPTLRAQAADALATDMGLSSDVFPDPWGDCTAEQTECRAAPPGAPPGQVEVPAEVLDLITLYTRHLGAPARRDVPGTAEGEALFHALGCASCHVPAFVTQSFADQPDLSLQTIWPYSDFLLHDMGAGLADAGGAEWRTAPLWGLGLPAPLRGRDGFLHDGRAETVLQAILWHGGEAQGARDRVIRLSAPDRAALLAFLGAL